MNYLGTLLSNEAQSMRDPENARRVDASSETLHNPIWRKLIVHWCYTVIDSIGADRELVFIAVGILDRYIAAQSPSKRAHQVTDKKAYETSVMSSLLLTTRLFAADSCICMNDLVEKSATSISISDIVETAKDMYKALTWERNSSTAARFAHAIVQLLPKTLSESSKAEIFQNSVYEIELSVHDEVCMSLPASLVAWMAVDNALEENGHISTEERCHFRSLVADCTGHSHSISLCRRLASFACDAVSCEEQDDNTVAFPQPRSRRDIPVVSQTDLSVVVSQTDLSAIVSQTSSEETDEESSLHRSKRSKYDLSAL
jgi:hypothetical protein